MEPPSLCTFMDHVINYYDNKFYDITGISPINGGYTSLNNYLADNVRLLYTPLKLGHEPFEEFVTASDFSPF